MGTVADSWPHLKDGAIKLGHQRLSDMHHLITTCVSQFHDDASAQVENLSGPSEEGLGLDLFKATRSASSSTASSTNSSGRCSCR
jgi:hypothetical protein